MESGQLRKLAVLTSGGDAPAMNAAVYGFVAAAARRGVEVHGVVDGYRGLVEGRYLRLDPREFRSHIYSAGTAIGSSRCPEFKLEETRAVALDKLKANGFDGLFVIGGDGSYMGASLLKKMGAKVVAAPGTIDNDVASSFYTIGYFSALEEIFGGIRKIRATSESHSQITFVEVMGRDCHDLTVAAALAGAVDYVVTNSCTKTQEQLEKVLREMIGAGKRGIVVLVTEKVYGPEHDFGLPSLKDLCRGLEKALGRQVRSSVLGYIQRGAVPTSWDLYMAQRFGIEAFGAMSEGRFGIALGFDGRDFYDTPLDEAVTMRKSTKTPLIDFVNSSYKI